MRTWLLGERCGRLYCCPPMKKSGLPNWRGWLALQLLPVEKKRQNLRLFCDVVEFQLMSTDFCLLTRNFGTHLNTIQDIILKGSYYALYNSFSMSCCCLCMNKICKVPKFQKGVIFYITAFFRQHSRHNIPHLKISAQGISKNKFYKGVRSG